MLKTGLGCKTVKMQCGHGMGMGWGEAGQSQGLEGSQTLGITRQGQ